MILLNVITCYIKFYLILRHDTSLLSIKNKRQNLSKSKESVKKIFYYTVYQRYILTNDTIN